MAESIGTARLDIVVDTSSLDAGVNKAKRSSADMAKAAQDASQKMDSGTKRQVQALERQIATLGKSRQEVIRWRIEQQTSGKVAAELTAKLDAQTAKLAASASNMDKFGAAAKRMAIAWAAVAAAAGGVALAAGVRNAINFADKLNDINIRLGVSAEALSGWAYAAQQSGTDIDALGVGLRKLSRNMADAMDDSSEQGKLFAALGVKVKDASGNLRRMEDVLPDVANAFKNVKNETLKAALAQEVFGKSGADLIEFMNLGSAGFDQMRAKAAALGIVLSQDTLSAADKFNDTVGDLKAATLGFSTQLASAMLPALTDAVRRLADLVSQGDLASNSVTLISSALNTGVGLLETYNGLVNRLSIAFGLLAESAAGYYEIQKNIYTLGFADGSVLGGVDRMTKAYEEGQAQLDATREAESPEGKARARVERQIKDAGRPLEHRFTEEGRAESAAAAARAAEIEARLNKLLSTGGKKPKKEGKSDAEKEAERLLKAYESMADSQRERIALFGNESEAAKVRYAVEHGELVKLTDAQKSALITNAERLDQLKAEADVQKELDRIEKDRTERVKDVLDSIRTETDLLGKSIEYQDTYNKLKYAGVDANSAYGRSIIEANKAMHEQAQATERQVELMDTFRSEASSAFADVINGTKSLSDAFKDMFDNIAERITQMIADRWIEQLFGQMGTTEGGSSGGWINAFMGMFSGGGGYAKGGAFHNGSVMAFANGGVFDRPTYFGMSAGRIGVMGEAGPEAIMPLERGPDGRLGVRASGDGGTFAPVLHQQFVVQGAPDNRTREQMARMSGREAARGIARTGR